MAAEEVGMVERKSVMAEHETADEVMMQSSDGSREL